MCLSPSSGTTRLRCISVPPVRYKWRKKITVYRHPLRLELHRNRHYLRRYREISTIPNLCCRAYGVFAYTLQTTSGEGYHNSGANLLLECSTVILISGNGYGSSIFIFLGRTWFGADMQSTLRESCYFFIFLFCPEHPVRLFLLMWLLI